MTRLAAAATLAAVGLLLAPGIEAAAPVCRYTINADTVLDRYTGLLWQRAASDSSYSQAGAESYCQGLNLGGFAAGWRLPERRELASLVDFESTSSPRIDSTAFPSTPPEEFWSSTAMSGVAGSFRFVDFSSGSDYYSPGSGSRRARCVRSPMVALSTASQRRTEGYSARVTVALDAPRATDVSVPYTLSGTATAGIDYSVSCASPIMIPAGQAGVTVTFSLNEDAITEAIESAIFTLGNPTNALLGSPSVHTLTIVSSCSDNYEWVHWTELQPEARLDHGFTADADTVLDAVTGLRWQRSVTGTYSWDAAKTYCQGLNLGGYASGWRLPTLIELESIVDFTLSGPTINRVAFPGTPSVNFWSASAFRATTTAYAVNFGTGLTVKFANTNSYAVRCVR